MKLIEGEKAYPIYSFSFTWFQDGDRDKKYPKDKELPEGRISNATSFYKMYKTQQKRATLVAYAMNWWAKYIYEVRRFSKEKLIIKNPELIKANIKFREYEVWLLTWFQHETFDIGQSNDEALRSFAKFVYRKERLGEDKYCLMGAEDRWRWHGIEDGTPNSKSEAPCRCKHCKEAGLIRIAH